MKFQGKIIIKGILETLTGLHIGGSKTALEIGGIDLNIIKTPNGVPFVPGSSFKGKIRSLLAREHMGANSPDKDPLHLKEMFGHSDKTTPFVTRVLVRDALLDVAAFNQKFPQRQMEFDYSDVKWENSVNRRTGTAQHPRQLERVPAGAQFHWEMVYDIYDTFGVDSSFNLHLNELHKAFQLLQHDYLGGQGSRGYGQVAFKSVNVEHYTLESGKYLLQTPISDDTIRSFAINMTQLDSHASHSA